MNDQDNVYSSPLIRDGDLLYIYLESDTDVTTPIGWKRVPQPWWKRLYYRILRKRIPIGFWKIAEGDNDTGFNETDNSKENG